MRLQTESRRQSGMVSIDSPRTSLAAFSSPPKRASFTPLTGRPGHMRISSVSETSLTSLPTPDSTPSPHTQAFNNIDSELHITSPPSSSRRYSGMFGHQLPPTSDLYTTTATEPPQVAASSVVGDTSEDLETLRKELKSVKAELVTVRHELMEAIEAKEASETCVKALREFIADNNVGAAAADGALSSPMPIKLPPPPTMTTGEEGADRGKPNGGWGFKLWGVDSPLKPSILSAPVTASSPSVNSTTPPPPVIAAAPLTRKLGGFFGSRSSLSSNSSQQVPPLQTNAAGIQLPLQCQRDSSYSFSDTSSMAEPISPSSDIHGLGAVPTSYFAEAQGYGSIVVKDVTNLDRVHTHALSVHDKDGIVMMTSGSVDLDGLR